MLKKNIKLLLVSLNLLFFTSFYVSAETIEIDFVYVQDTKTPRNVNGETTAVPYRIWKRHRFCNFSGDSTDFARELFWC